MLKFKRLYVDEKRYVQDSECACSEEAVGDLCF